MGGGAERRKTRRFYHARNVSGLARSAPTFVYLAFQNVHAPYTCEERYRKLYAGRPDLTDDEQTMFGYLSELDDVSVEGSNCVDDESAITADQWAGSWCPVEVRATAVAGELLVVLGPLLDAGLFHVAVLCDGAHAEHSPFACDVLPVRASHSRSPSP